MNADSLGWLVRAMVDSIDAPVFCKDSLGMYRECNRAFCDLILGLPRDQIIGKGVFDLPERIPKELAKIFHDQDLALFSDRGTQIYESKVLCRDGAVREYLFTKNLFPGPDGDYIVGVMLDVSPLKKAERELSSLENRLIQSQRLEAMGTMAGGLAHNFNNILMGIYGYIQVCSSDLKSASNGSTDPTRADLEISPPTLHKWNDRFERVLSLLERGSGTIRQLMNFAGGGPLKLRKCSLNEIIEKNPWVENHEGNASIVKSLSPDLVTVKADRDLIDQTITNLVLNAIHAVKPGGIIEISTHNTVIGEAAAMEKGISVGRFASVSVRDEGIGISPEDLNRIFEPFFTTKGKGSGSGLGLASALAIIRNHGGSIDLESEPGTGSTFTFHLPEACDKESSE